MKLIDLINLLKSTENQIVKFGFSHAHAYTGNQEDVAFVPTKNVTISSMLASAMFALENELDVFPNGKTKVSQDAECWISEFGYKSGEIINETLIKFMIGIE